MKLIINLTNLEMIDDPENIVELEKESQKEGRKLNFNPTQPTKSEKARMSFRSEKEQYTRFRSYTIFLYHKTRGTIV